MPSFAASMGQTVSATSDEIVTENARTKPNSENRLPTMPGMNEIGTNTATSVAVVASTAKTISRVPRTAAARAPAPKARCRVMFSTTMMASSTTRPVAMTSAQQRQDVDREAGRPHGGQRADERNGDCERRGDGGADGAEKRVNDEDDDHGREQQAPGDLVNGLADEDGVVRGDGDLDALGQRLAQLVHGGADAVGDGDGVRLGLADDLDADGGLAVEARHGGRLLEGPADESDVADLGLRVELEGADVGGGSQRGFGAHQQLLRRVLEGAGRAC